jgi:hypothetical protein
MITIGVTGLVITLFAAGVVFLLKKKNMDSFYSGKSGVIDHLIPDQTDHPKLSRKSECFRGHFYGYKVG